MSRTLHRIGARCAARPWLTVSAWVAALVLALGLAAAAGGTTRDDYDVPGTSSQAGTDLLRERFPDLSGTEARVVVHDPNGAKLDPALLDQVASALRAVEQVGLAGPAQSSADGDTAIIDVRYTVPVTDLPDDAMDLLRAATGPARDAGLQVEYAGQVPEGEKPTSHTGELAGVLIALVLLIIAFGSVVAAGLPIISALVGLGIGSSGILLLAALTDIGTTAPTAAAMVGLGIGIDYALLLVTRHCEGLAADLAPRAAAARATATAGRSILVAGAIVLLSLFGLVLSGLAAYRTYGYATAIVVATVMTAAITLVPALCVISGRRLIRRRRVGHTGPRRPPMTARWAARVGRRPAGWALLALVALLALGAPALDMRTWPQDAGSQPTENTVRRAYDLIAAEYGPGAYAPLVVAVDLTSVPQGSVPALREQIAAVPGVATVSEALMSPEATAAALTVQLEFSPQDERSGELVDQLRAEVLPAGAEITGVTAVFVDIADLLAERLWLVVAVVVGLSLILLTIVFRSILVPVKAALVNLLSVAAAYGVLTMVFQWGWGSRLLGVDRPVPVSTWVPLLLFAVLFGLSMDYEVFLLSRIREEWLATADPLQSVVRGLAATARTITAAALIMVAVFAGFMTNADIVTKMIGVGLATAVALDATIVRLVLVPATMMLFGRANWWLPRWLDRMLPTLGHGRALPDVLSAENATNEASRPARQVSAR
ncbi:MMPL family transporter [Catellatospora citrea]|uniref:Membrane protein n=1 Tax=Catellatospora citrea TaxID=53366 RepID=A0A8J3KJV3_9ACTN|nr:MMPL family transporter [Catellatospora citrea]RKE05489.1 RND superfamily putative drug exporter [Catellatospora citrea]GIG00164.1 membrane protein [Catellatospora citrea]